ncbi:MAG: hypothetical protein WBO37_03090 [Gammaproteobacteria bacterium]
MKKTRALPVLLVLCIAVAGVVYLVTPQRDAAQEWESRKPRFQQAAVHAEPLVRAITAYVSAFGHPPSALADLVPGFIQELPATGLQECSRFEYRSLVHKQGSIVWYDLGSRQGEPYSGASHYSDGDPGHAILVFVLDAKGQITSALIDRIPKGRDPLDFDPQRWKEGENRIEMALALADTYRLYGMPRDVFERLLGAPDGSRSVHGTPWELRINCPTGLLNHDSFVYWPSGEYPQHLYGGFTESVGRWVYVHS